MANDSWDKWTITPSPTQAHAFLGIDANIGHTFRFNPDQVAWDYQENTFSQDTLGGRVVQLLSVGLNGITIQGRAGNRGELQRLAKNIKQIMTYQVKTLNAVAFKVPSRNWDFKVYVQAMPQISWDVASTSYPYQLNLLVEEDLSGVKTREINSEVLKRLASGVGHDASKEIHGGDAAAYAEIVDLIIAGWSSLASSSAASAISTGLDAVAGAISENYTASCGAGADQGLETGYKDNKPYQIRICVVEGVEVNTAISANVAALFRDARAAGIKMTGGGFRTMAEQIAAGARNGCPPNWTSSSQCGTPTAPAGYSNHQMGLAIDFSQNGSSLSSSSSGFAWLKQNAAKYGLKNLPSEPWHWSVDGG